MQGNRNSSLLTGHGKCSDFLYIHCRHNTVTKGLYPEKYFISSQHTLRGSGVLIVDIDVSADGSTVSRESSSSVICAQ